MNDPSFLFLLKRNRNVQSKVINHFFSAWPVFTQRLRYDVIWILCLRMLRCSFQDLLRVCLVKIKARQMGEKRDIQALCCSYLRPLLDLNEVYSLGIRKAVHLVEMDSLRLNIDTDSWDPLRNGKPWNFWDVTDRIFGKTRVGWWGNEIYWSLLASERCTRIWGSSKWDATKSPANSDEWIRKTWWGMRKNGPQWMSFTVYHAMQIWFLSSQLWSMDWIEDMSPWHRNQIGNGLTTPQSNIAMDQKTGL